jgi:hypothetical protein
MDRRQGNEDLPTIAHQGNEHNPLLVRRLLLLLLLLLLLF